VICPKAAGDPAEEVIEGITIYKYRPARGGNGVAAFVREYLYSLIATAWLCRKAWRRQRFDVVQACNPPDIFWTIALALRLKGVKFVFDHHDLCPELYESRFGRRAGPLYWGLRLLEWCTFQTAHHVISTNESYREVAMRRGHKRASDVTVVRTGPDPESLQKSAAVPARRRGRDHLVAYLGVMGPQDGVDLAVRAADQVVHGLGRTDVSFTFMGSGDSLDDLIALRDRLGLGDYVELTGRVPDSVVSEVLSTANVALCPDPKTPLNDVSTMNKTMEYMAFSIPVVAFDLHETRISAKDAAVYVGSNDVAQFAQAIVDLLDDEPRRTAMAEVGRSRVVDTLAWSHQRANYLWVYGLLAPAASRLAGATAALPAQSVA
jgi:glycosyltransferase involved in cell wall biosynthesis